MKAKLLLFIFISLLGPFTFGLEGPTDDVLSCLQPSETLILGIEENELNFKSEGCTEAQITNDLNVALSEVLTSSTSTYHALEVSKTEIIDVIEVLSSKHDGSNAFPLRDIKKIEEFWTSVESNELKQKGYFSTLTNDLQSDYFLVILYTKDQKDIVVVYKTINEFVDISDTNTTDSNTSI